MFLKEQEPLRQQHLLIKTIQLKPVQQAIVNHPQRKKHIFQRRISEYIIKKYWKIVLPLWYVRASETITSSEKSTNDKIIIAICLGYQHILEVAIPSGIILLVGIIAVISCVVSKRPEKKQEEMNADENPVYGVYQLTETYERQYSTNEAVDNNDYYEQ